MNLKKVILPGTHFRDASEYLNLRGQMQLPVSESQVPVSHNLGFFPLHLSFNIGDTELTSAITIESSRLTNLFLIEVLVNWRTKYVEINSLFHTEDVCFL